MARASDYPRVSIVILNWNRPADTIICLHSLEKLDYPSYEIVVVDNGSTDDSVRKIRSTFPCLDILELGHNQGYAEGNNVGIRHALANESEYFLILNNDTIVAPTMLTELVKVAESYPDAGMVGPTMYCMDSPDTVFAAGSFVDWWRGVVWHRGMFQPIGTYAQFKEPESVDFIAGCCVLVRKQVVEMAGVLDPIYHLNYEDVEWCVRVQRHGFKLLYAPRAVMWHKVSASLGKTSPCNSYYMTRNALLFFWKNSPPHIRWIPVLHVMFRTLRTVAAWSLKPSYWDRSYGLRRDAIILGMRDFLQGRFGEMGPDVARVCYATES